jgi:hypothetical protein
MQQCRCPSKDKEERLAKCVLPWCRIIAALEAENAELRQKVSDAEWWYIEARLAGLEVIHRGVWIVYCPSASSFSDEWHGDTPAAAIRAAREASE